ncbi:MAG: czcR [Planctomycetaceae bacterium]|nr:czcR [Planctomycetaceae bacterium]
MRVLVVDDEPDMRDAVAMYLREESYSVDTAADGKDGLYKAQTWDYDAIVLDVMLPLVDGWKFLGELRKSKTTPVLMLTARDAVEDRIRGLNSGADDYLVKPFVLSELVARVRALIRRAAGKAKPVIEIGDVYIDMASRTVSLAGEEVSLTGKEYSLVEYLALHLGELVTRTMLYDHLFDEHDDSMSNLVDVYVSNVRRKLGRDLITTRRGQGYIIEQES